jgi:hypothetical protein
LELEVTERLILLGYSKGATDILHFLVDYPEHAKKVTAVLSGAGVINGTSLADKFADTYENWFQNTPIKACEPGDGGVLKSLKRSVQFPWLAVNPLPQNVRYFSIAAFTARENVQAGLLFTYDLLRKIDPRNDGQVIFYDQIIPGASPLGYINLDHWAIAVPVKEKTATSAWQSALFVWEAAGFCWTKAPPYGPSTQPSAGNRSHPLPGKTSLDRSNQP